MTDKRKITNVKKEERTVIFGSPYSNGLELEEAQERVLVWCEACKRFDNVHHERMPERGPLDCDMCSAAMLTMAWDDPQYDHLYEHFQRAYIWEGYLDEDPYTIDPHNFPVLDSLTLVHCGFVPGNAAHESVLSLSGIEGLVKYVEAEKADEG